MQRGILILDGLWNCLCPSFDRALLQRPISCLARDQRQWPNPPVSTQCQRRRLTASSATRHSGAGKLGKRENGRRVVDELTAYDHNDQASTSLYGLHEPRVLHYEKKDPPPFSSSSRRRPRKLENKPWTDVPHTIQRMSDEELEAELQSLRRIPKIRTVTNILRTLIRDRHVPPHTRHYRALILAHTDAMRGSSQAVRSLLSEMEGNGIPIDSVTLHAALQVLAVHPDYLLRQEVLQKLRDRWLPLSPAGWHFVVAGLIREGQFELAIDQLKNMERKEIQVESWLHSLLIYNLCDAEEFDEVLDLMRWRADRHQLISPDLWAWVLDAASEAIHHELTCYVWEQKVVLGYMYPSYGVCANVLVVASRTGDTKLAVSVIRHLQHCQIPISLEDYEMLVESFAMAGKFATAFEVLCKMHASGIAVQESSTRSLLTAMFRARIQPEAAWDMLRKLKDQSFVIPLECVKVIFEACERIPDLERTRVDKAIRLYEELYTLCPEGADVSIYNTLLKMCRKTENADGGLFLIREMSALGVVPDATTFETIIVLCLRSARFRSAYMYFEDMLKRKCSPSAEGAAEIRDLSSGSKDTFALYLRSHPLIEGASSRTTDRKSRKSRSDEDATSMPEFRKISGKTEIPEELARLRGRLVTLTPRPRLPKNVWRMLSKKRRKKKRRLSAIARGMEEEGWDDWDAAAGAGADPETVEGNDAKA